MEKPTRELQKPSDFEPRQTWEKLELGITIYFFLNYKLAIGKNGNCIYEAGV